MSTSRVPRPRTTSETPRGKATSTSTAPRASSTANSAASGARSARGGGLAVPTLKTKTSASRLSPTSPRKTPVSPARDAPASPVSKPALSIREQIASRRAEQLKKSAAIKSTSLSVPDEQAVDDAAVIVQEDDILGRWSIRDTIDRAKGSGSIVLASRELARIPSYLFESHLSVTPEPLKNAPPEVVEPEGPPQKAKRVTNTAWYEQVDLTTLKLWDNAIVELQPELSLFGSLKVVDLHKNKLTHLPDSLPDLVFLTHLDLSENELESLPANLASMPNLHTLNLAHNKLSTIPLKIVPSNDSQSRSQGFFSATIERAKVTMPALRILNISHNQIRTETLNLSSLPQELADFDVSGNELGVVGPLFKALLALPGIQSLRFSSCSLTDSTFPQAITPPPSLSLLDLGENEGLTEDVIRRSIKANDIQIAPVNSNVRGVLNVVHGKPGPVKESWEIEAENRPRLRKSSATSDSVFSVGSSGPSKVRSPKQSIVKPLAPSAEIPKETWEIEAEQGLLTEGGRRRARALAAARDTPSPPISEVASLSLSSVAVSLVQFYDGPHATLTLPKSQPQTRTHNRSFSVVATVNSASASELAVPLPTLPLPSILSQSFANSIKVLVLSGRRMESSFVLPSSGLGASVLPHLEELCLDNCNLTNEVSVSQENGQAPNIKEPLLEMIAALFPTLSTLDLSYNLLTSLSGVGALLTPDTDKKRKGLSTLRIRGNKLSSLEPLAELGQTWRGGPGIPGFRGEEIDLRDNEIGRLPPLLGLMPLDVLLVEGNTFRVPARRVWEKEGSKGLLKWLADRV